MHSSYKPWFIAGLAFIVLGFSRGFHSSFGVFNVALLESFGWSRGATAGIFSVVLSVDALLSPVVGYLLDRYGPKKVVVAGCLALMIGLFFSARVTELGSCIFTSVWSLRSGSPSWVIGPAAISFHLRSRLCFWPAPMAASG
jgi:MFS family permease